MDSYKVAGATVVKLQSGRQSKEEEKEQICRSTGNYCSTVNLSKKQV
jgi:threonine dehydratase